LNERIGVVKAYVSRVGSGPVMGELDYNKDIGRFIQTEGGEFGTTTGRPRRIAWLDLVSLRYAIRINGLTGLAITKLDILGLLESFKVILFYEHKETGEKNYSKYPAQLSKFSDYVPVFREFKGWGKLESVEWLKLIKSGFDSFPVKLKEFVSFIETETKIQVYIISVGQDRDLTYEKVKILN
jgi:adenylosuccinate synthase